MTKTYKLKCILLSFLLLFFIFCFLYFVYNFFLHKFPVRDEIEVLFFSFKFCDSRFIAHIVEAAIGFVPMFILNKHPFDYTGRIFSVIQTIIYFTIMISFLLPLWFFSAKNALYKLFVSIIVVIISGLFFFDSIILNDDEMCINLEYISAFIPFSFFWFFFYFFSINEKCKNKFLILFSFIMAFCLGISVEIFNILTTIMLIVCLFYFVLFKKSCFSDDCKNKKAIIILLLGFIIGLLCYYNPWYLKNGLGDRNCVSYDALYKSIQIFPSVFKIYIIVLFNDLLQNLNFLLLVLLSLLSYSPFANIKNKIKNIFPVYIISVLIFFVALVLITDLSENNNFFWYKAVKFQMVFILLNYFYLMNLLILDIVNIKYNNKKELNIKLLLTVLIILIIPPSFFPDNYETRWKEKEKINYYNKRTRFITEKIYLHYLKQNKTALLPLSCRDNLEAHREKIMGIDSQDIHCNNSFPLYNSLRNIYYCLEKVNNKQVKLVGYRYIDDKEAYKYYYNTGGGKINLKNINFSDLLDKYYPKNNRYREFLYIVIKEKLKK